MKLLVLSVLLTGATVVAAPAPVPRDDRRTDLERLQGKWEWTTEDGIKTASITGKRIRWCVGEAGECEQAFAVAPAKNPKEIDFDIVTDLVSSGIFTSMGIYRLEGDTLTIHQSLVDRPPAFKARGGDSVSVFRRKKP